MQFKITQQGNDLSLAIPREELNLADTLDCGQCFRFVKEGDYISGVAQGYSLRLTQTEDTILFHDTSEERFNRVWRDYFDLGRDYAALKKMLSADEPLRRSLAYAGGIRILRQDSFEALISFIISQNNNIPRIKTSINKLCRKFGEPLDGGICAFPTPRQLAGIKKEDLSEIGLGYRDSYLVDCVERVNSGEIDIAALQTMDIDAARENLRRIKGVGIKVAECALLFGFYRAEAFPVDTWIKKVLVQYYPQGFPSEFQAVAGIAQQYLFHYIRTCKEG